MKIQTLKTKAQILLFSIIIFGTIIGAGIFGMINTRTLTNLFELSYTNNVVPLISIIQVESNILRTNALIQNAYYNISETETDIDELITKILEKREENTKLINEFSEAVILEQEKVLYQDFRESLTMYRTALDKVIDLLRVTEDSCDKVCTAIDSVLRLGGNLQDSVEDLVNFNKSIAEARYIEGLNIAQQIFIYIWIMIAIICIIAVGLALLPITILKAKHERDELTGLYNRNIYKEKCQSLINKYPDTLGAFVFIDLNGFKIINDTYGHAMGDAVLEKVGHLLKNFEDSKTIPFRIAGDELGFFRMGFESTDEIIQMIQNGELWPEEKISIDGNDLLHIKIKYSAGVSIYNVHANDVNRLQEFADFAMYKAKKERFKTSSIELFDRVLYDKENETKQKYYELDSILENNELDVLYKPIFYLKNKELYGFEGVGGTNNPYFSNMDELIKTAKKAKKLSDVKTLLAERMIHNYQGEKLLINLEHDTAKVVIVRIEIMMNTIKEKEFSTKNIIIGILGHQEWNMEDITTIRELVSKYNLTLALNDYGTETSHDFLIVQLKPRFVIITEAFVRDIDKDTDKRAYLLALIEFTKALNVSILCTDIDTREEFETLQEIGILLGQGNYLANE